MNKCTQKIITLTARHTLSSRPHHNNVREKYLSQYYKRIGKHGGLYPLINPYDNIEKELVVLYKELGDNQVSDSELSPNDPTINRIRLLETLTSKR